MKRFIQLHFLTSYPPSNLNRDDLGRPKTARMGGVDRLRISSQSLKRAWRTSDLFQDALNGYIGTRTKRIGSEVRDRLTARDVSEKKAKTWAQLIAAQFGKLKKANKEQPDADLEIEQLAHIGPDEWRRIDALVETLASENRAPEENELQLIRKPVKAADIALFGRMLAANPRFNIDAAAQVAHAVTINAAAVEDDYFTAVDDLNTGEEDAGAGHIGETGFGAGVFYVYVCINRDLLLESLEGDVELTRKTLGAFVEAAAKVPPSGKQNSFASRAYAEYILAETGDQQPRSLSVAFLKPVTGKDLLGAGVAALERWRDQMDRAYGPCADARQVMNVEAGEGTLDDIIAFVTG
jgi:CRISPR system Cascade subunit CasC